jgi:hypothetical protein
MTSKDLVENSLICDLPCFLLRKLVLTTVMMNDSLSNKVWVIIEALDHVFTTPLFPPAMFS